MALWQNVADSDEENKVGKMIIKANISFSEFLENWGQPKNLGGLFHGISKGS